MNIISTTKLTVQKNGYNYSALYRFSALPNGLILIEDLTADLSGTTNRDGSYHSGDVRLPQYTVQDVLHRAAFEVAA